MERLGIDAWLERPYEEQDPDAEYEKELRANWAEQTLCLVCTHYTTCPVTGAMPPDDYVTVVQCRRFTSDQLELPGVY